MDKETGMLLEIIENSKPECRLTAFILLLEKTESEVNWAYEVWDGLRTALQSPDRYKRAAAGQLLAYLSISDPEQRILQDFSQIWNETYHEDIEVAEDVLNATWRIGLAGKPQRTVLLRAYEQRLSEVRQSRDKRARMTSNVIAGNLLLLSEQVADRSVQVLLEKANKVANRNSININRMRDSK